MRGASVMAPCKRRPQGVHSLLLYPPPTSLGAKPSSLGVFLVHNSHPFCPHPPLCCSSIFCPRTTGGISVPGRLPSNHSGPHFCLSSPEPAISAGSSQLCGCSDPLLSSGRLCFLLRFKESLFRFCGPKLSCHRLLPALQRLVHSDSVHFLP
jgi:hypothetical protein